MVAEGLAGSAREPLLDVNRRGATRFLRWLCAAALALSAGIPVHAATVTSCSGAEHWVRVGVNTWRKQALIRSQGVTSDDHGWIFSWQGGGSRNGAAHHVLAYNTFPGQLFPHPTLRPDGTNHIGPTHIGDGDEHGGLFYAPEG